MKYYNVVLILFYCFLHNGFCDSILSKFHQHEYKMRNIRTELISYNKDYFNFMEIKTFKYNRSIAAINVTMNSKMNMATQLDVIGQAYKFMSNEYRHFPARARLNFCKILKANVFGVLDAMSKCGNITSCSFTKETTYHVCNFILDPTHFPPLVPDGEYKVELELLYLENSIAITNLYTEIYRPIYPKK